MRKMGRHLWRVGRLKLQTPNTKVQTPNTKHQAPEKLQAPSSKLEARAAVWSLELGISLVFGAWFLVFRFRDFSGAWCLGFGVSLCASIRQSAAFSLLSEKAADCRSEEHTSE